MIAILKMIVVLSSICAISGFALSYLKMSTAKIIEEQVLTYVQGPAILKVFANAENKPIEDRKKFTLEDGREITVFPALQNGKLVGVALEDFGQGYGGDIGVMVGFNVENDTLVNVGITTMKETPGLGTLIAAPKFTAQFVGKPMNVESKAKGGTIDAISGATISSVGTILAVNKAAQIYTALKPQILESWK